MRNVLLPLMIAAVLMLLPIFTPVSYHHVSQPPLESDTSPVPSIGGPVPTTSIPGFSPMDTYIGFLKETYLSREFPNYFKGRSLYDRPKKFINVTIALKQRQPGKKRKDEALNKLHGQFEDTEQTLKFIKMYFALLSLMIEL